MFEDDDRANMDIDSGHGSDDNMHSSNGSQMSEGCSQSSVSSSQSSSYGSQSVQLDSNSSDSDSDDGLSSWRNSVSSTGDERSSSSGSQSTNSGSQTFGSQRSEASSDGFTEADLEALRKTGRLTKYLKDCRQPELVALCQYYHLPFERQGKKKKVYLRVPTLRKSLEVIDAVISQESAIRKAKAAEATAAKVRNQVQARLLIWDPKHGIRTTLNITISRGAGLDIPDQMYRDFIQFVRTYMLDGFVAKETAPFSDKGAHVHVQFVGDALMRNTDRVTLNEVSRRIKVYCKVPKGKHLKYQVMVKPLAQTRRGGRRTQTKHMLVGYVLKEMKEAGWEGFCFNLSPAYCQSGYDEYLGGNSAARKHGKVLDKQRSLAQAYIFVVLSRCTNKLRWHVLVPTVLYHV